MSRLHPSTRPLYNTLLSLLLGAILSLPLAGCSDKEDDSPEAPVTPEDVPGRHRTVLIYMVASNNLGTDGNNLRNIAMMEKWAGEHSLNDCNVILYHMRYADNVISTTRVATLERLTREGFVTVRRYEVNPSVIATDPEVMAEVMAEVRGTFPAESYGLVMWSHGDPWREGSFSTMGSRHWGADGIGTPGSQTYWSISLPPMGEVLTQTGPWEFIYFDSCYGANIETAYELRNATPLVIGSSTEVVSWGMPYDQTLTYMTATEFDAEALAQCTFDYYATFDSPNFDSATNRMARSCTMSVTRTDRLEAVAQAARSVWEGGARFNYATDRPIQPFMPSNASPNTLSFDMADTYAHLTGADPEALTEFQAALERAVTYHANTPYMWQGASYELPINTYCGLGTYIYPENPTPTAAQPDPYYGYSRLKWYTDVMSHATAEPLR